MPEVETAVPAAPESSATAFEQDLGEMFGDFSGGGETPDSPDSAEGTTPAEPADGAAEPGTEPVPAADDAPPSDGTTPAADIPAVEAGDPFTDTTAASYMLNGQPVSVEDIRVFKEGGAVIRPEALPNILSKLAERDTLSEGARTAKQQYDTLSKVSEWTGPDNRTVSGPEAAVERIVAHAAVLSENELIVSQVLTCPDLHAAGFLTTELRADGKGGQYEAVIFRPDAIKSLQTQNELRQLKASQAIRDHFKTVISQSAQSPPAPINFETATPPLVKLIADQSKLDASALTAGDRAMFAKQLPYHLKDGLASLDWQEMVKERIQLRTDQKTSSRQLVSSTEDATKKGLANMAAAARGMKPRVAVTTPATPVSPQHERMKNEGDLYDQMERAAARSLRAAR